MDHDRYVGHLRVGQKYGAELYQATKDEDLAAFFVAQASLFGTDRLASAQSSRVFCETVARTDDVEQLCARLEDVPGGRYGARVYDTMREFNAAFGPRIQFPPPLTAEHRLTVLGLQQPETIALVQRTGDSVRSLQPTDEFGGDHERLLRFFDELLEVNWEIQQAAVARDEDAQKAGFAKANGIINGARSPGAFSKEFRPLIASFLPAQ